MWHCLKLGKNVQPQMTEFILEREELRELHRHLSWRES